MAALNLTSYDPTDLKSSLIDFIRTTPEFSDYEYREGSALNTILDILVRNTFYIAYQANMNATESFLDSAQIRANIVSHAQKLSYTPKSRTASTVVVDIEVTPSEIGTANSIRANKGSIFLHRAGDTLYSFTNPDDIVLFRTLDSTFVARNVELKQGSLLTRTYLYSTDAGAVEIPYTNMDTSTLRVFVQDGTSGVRNEFSLVTDITDAERDSYSFYLSENYRGNYEIEFGRNVLGAEPEDGSQIIIEFVNVEAVHANGLDSLFAANPIGGFSNIQITVTTEAYGGSERASLDTIKFLAPKLYQAQNRAVREQDYQAIILREFAFIKAARVWGGEKNNPPYYGKVFISAIPQEGYIISDSVKRVIENRIRDFSVVAITPQLVDSDFIGIDLSIKFLYNTSQTSATEDQIKAYIASTVQMYNDNQLGLFDFWFNHSELVRLIKAIPSVYTVEIDKVLYSMVEANPGIKTKYSYNFSNPIIPGSFRIRSEIVLDVSTDDIRVYDLDGKIWQEINRLGVIDRAEIGTIDYESGLIDFNMLLLSSDTDNLVVEVLTEEDNVYISNNQIVQIGLVDISLIDRKV